MLEIAKSIREKSNITIRVNTNGHSDLIAGRPTAADFEGLFDVVSISLNTSDPKIYDDMCLPKYDGAHKALIDFAASVKKYVPRVVLSVVDTTISREDIENCRKIAENIGVEFRLREYI
jgi:TatD family-associated radical SAM protein